MPIYESDDSVFWTNKGRNLVFRDTARHRADPLERCGPHTIAKEYAYPMQKQLEHKIAPQLVAPTPLTADLEVKYSFLRTEERVNAWLMQIKHNAFVMPLPLVDLALFVSRMGVVAPQYWYYPSALRIEWARHELAISNFYLSAGDGRKAAEAATKVFGTLLPAMLTQNPFHQESQIFKTAWQTLQLLVDAESFLEKLFRESRIIVDDRQLGKLKDIWEREPGMKKYFINPATNELDSRTTVQRIGPRELTIAEELKDTEQELNRINMKAETEGFTKTLKELKRMCETKIQRLLREYDAIYSGMNYDVLGHTRFLSLDVYQKIEPPPVLKDLEDQQKSEVALALLATKI